MRFLFSSRRKRRSRTPKRLAALASAAVAVAGVTVLDKTITQGKGAKAVVKVTAPDGIEVTGKVKIVIKGTGKALKAKVVNGKAIINLPKFTKAGSYTLRAVYLGSDLLTRAHKLVEVTVS